MARKELILFAALFFTFIPQHYADSIPLRLHNDNPHYFEFRGEPTVLVTSAEHYSSAINLDFDYVEYFNEIESKGLNYTRLFTGSYVSDAPDSPLNPEPERYIAPWARSNVGGYRGGGNKFDLDTWDTAYFSRLHNIISEASDRGIIVEITFFCVFYDNKDWWNSPLSSVSNINGIGNIDRKLNMTMDNGNLMDYQKGMVTKIVTELEGYDNIFFEICNEPYLFDADNPLPEDPELSRKNVHMDWLREMAAAFNLAQQDFTHKYLLAQNIDQFKTVITENEGKLTDAIDSISIFNFHYNARYQGDINASVGDNYELNRPIGCDENGNYPNNSSDEVYRKQGWNFLMAGGALFNNLDFTFQIDDPSGTQDNPRTNFGGGSTLRTQLGILKSFMDTIDFINMEPYYNLPTANSPVPDFSPTYIDVRCMAKTGHEYAIYVGDAGLTSLTLKLSQNNYIFAWMDPRDGTIVSSGSFAHNGGNIQMSVPSYAEDLVLKVFSNSAPSVDAGIDASITFPVTTYTLQGVVTDDGLPVNSTVETTWTVVSGPGSVTFDDAASVNAVAEFSEAGTYTLRLTATDGELTASDIVIIFVNTNDPPPPSQSNLLAHWQLDEVTGDIAYDNTSNDIHGYLSNAFTFDNYSVDGQIGSALSFDGISDYVSMGDAGILDMGFSNFSLSSWVFIPEHKNTKQFLIIKAADGSKGYGLRLNNDNTIQGIFNSTNYNIYCGNVVPTENEWHHVVVVFNRTDKIFKIYLDGVEAGYSDIPDGSVSNNKEFLLGAYFVGGSYKRFFTGYLDDVRIYDQALSQQEILDMYDAPGNTAPEVDAGPNQTIQFPNSATLNGTVTDDGLPNNTLTTNWSKVSGPGTVTFGDAGLLSTTAQFSEAGVYRLSLFADDGELTASNSIRIVVEEEAQSDPNLIGHWTFDEVSGTTAADVSVNQNNGLLENMSFEDNFVEGQFGGALKFNGIDEIINMGDPSDGSLDMGQNDFTLSTWIYIPKHQNSKQFIIIKAIDGSPGYGLRVNNDNTIEGIINTNGYNVYTGNTVPTEKQWHHVAVVFDRTNGQFQLYLDGSTTGSTSINSGSINNNQDFEIGAYFVNGMYKRFFKGYIDDVRIYNYALSASEVQNLSSPASSAFGGGFGGDNHEEERLLGMDNTILEDYSLINYPNPFTNETTISFNLKRSADAKIKVFNTLGMEVQTLFDERAEAGRQYEIPFNGNQLPEGIYFYILQSGENINVIKKMILFR